MATHGRHGVVHQAPHSNIAAPVNRPIIMVPANFNEVIGRLLNPQVTMCKIFKASGKLIVTNQSTGATMELETHPKASNFAELQASLVRKTLAVGVRVILLHAYKYERAPGVPDESNRTHVRAFFIRIAQQTVVVAYDETRDNKFILKGSVVDEDGTLKALSTFQPEHKPEASVRAWSAGDKKHSKLFKLVFHNEGEASMEYVAARVAGPTPPRRVTKRLLPAQEQEPNDETGVLVTSLAATTKRRKVAHCDDLEDDDDVPQTPDQVQVQATVAAAAPTFPLVPVDGVTNPATDAELAAWLDELPDVFNFDDDGDVGGGIFDEVAAAAAATVGTSATAWTSATASHHESQWHSCPFDVDEIHDEDVARALRQ